MAENGDFIGDSKESQVNLLQPRDQDKDLQHFDFTEDKSLAVDVIEKISTGGEASIDAVHIKDTFRGAPFVCVRRSYTGLTKSNFGKWKELHKREIDILKKLRDERHCVELVGSYTKTAKGSKIPELVILHNPRADLDLASLLEKTPMERQGVLSNHNLEKGIGCLASALYFLHNARIRHKDISSKNILVYGGNMLFADFGLSTDFSDTNNSESTGEVRQQRSYRPPEGASDVANRRKRSCSSDVFSLGCVFFEILASLFPSIVGAQEAEDFSLIRPYYNHLPDIHRRLETKRDDIVAAKEHRYLLHEFWLRKTRQMLERPQEQRPRMLNIISEVKWKLEKRISGFDDVACEFCLKNRIQKPVPGSTDVPTNLDTEDGVTETILHSVNPATHPTGSKFETMTPFKVVSWAADWTFMPILRSLSIFDRCRWHLTFYLDNGRSLRMYGTKPTGNVDLKFDFGDMLIERVVFTAGWFAGVVTLYQDKTEPTKHRFSSKPCDETFDEGITVWRYKITWN